MKLQFLLLCLSLFFSYHTLSQSSCDSSFQISGDTAFFCSTDTITLYIEGDYDSLVWMERSYVDSMANWVGYSADSLFLTSSTSLDYYSAIVYYNEGCIDTTHEVELGSIAFIPLHVIHLNNPDSFASGGVIYYCQDSTAKFIVSQPFRSNIDWIKDGVFLGENDSILQVSYPDSGDYTVQAAPFMCPSEIHYLGVDIRVRFKECQTTSIEKPGFSDIQIMHIGRNIKVSSPYRMDQFQLYDVQGRLLYATKKSIFEFDVNAHGVYFLRMLAKGITEQKAIVVSF